MHELSLVYRLVATIENAARNAEANHVESVQVRLGPLMGISKDSLQFCYELATKGTLLEGSLLQVEEVPIIMYCPSCKNESTLSNLESFICPICGAISTDIRQGRELELKAVELVN